MNGYFNYKKANSGFTLIETLVAFIVISAAVVGPVSLITRGIYSSSFSKNKVIALNLAQEGIELVRAIRENNKICQANGDPGWQWDRDTPGTGTLNNTNSGRIDAFTLTPISCAGLNIQNPTLLNGACNTNFYINSDGQYNYQGGTQTTFKRCINITSLENENTTYGTIPRNEKMEITSTVEWTEKSATKSISLVETLYNWE